METDADYRRAIAPPELAPIAIAKSEEEIPLGGFQRYQKSYSGLSAQIKT